MYKLDRLDKKIIIELDRNARLSYSQLSRRVKTKKEMIAYRMQRLTREKVITQFVTFFSLGKIHFFNYKIYFQFHGLQKHEEEQMLQELQNDPEVIWIAKCEGRWDLMISHYAKNIKEFSKIKDRIFSKFGQYFQEYAVLINDDAYLLHRDYFHDRNIPRKSSEYIGEVANIKLDKKEKKLLQLLSKSARMPLIEMSKDVKLTAKTISQKIKKFQKLGLIQCFTIGLNLKKLDIHYFKVFIYLNNMTKNKFEKLFNFCKEQTNVVHIIKPIGPWELELEIESEDPHFIHNISKNLRNNFPDTIKKIESATISEELKLDFFPQHF